MSRPLTSLPSAVLFPVLALAGCDEPSTGSAALPPTSAPAPASASAVPVPAPLTLGDGCYAGVEPEKPDATIEALGRACAHGMVPLFERAPRTKLEPGAFAEFELGIDDPSKCIRVAAAIDSNEDVDLELLSPSGELTARDDLQAPFALLNPSGTVCVDAKGKQLIRVRAEHAALAVVQAWRAK